MEMLIIYLVNFFILFGIITILLLFRDYKRSLKYLEKAKEEEEKKVKDRTRELEELSKKQEEIIKERTRELQEKVNDLEKVLLKNFKIENEDVIIIGSGSTKEKAEEASIIAALSLT